MNMEPSHDIIVTDNNVNNVNNEIPKTIDVDNTNEVFPSIWCSSCKSKTDNVDPTIAECKGRIEGKVRSSIKALCATCGNKKHTFHKSKIESKDPVKQASSTETTITNKKKRNTKSKKDLNTMEAGNKKININNKISIPVDKLLAILGISY